MKEVKPLPPYLTQRYLGWKATKFLENKVWYKHLEDEGQHPRAMVISCCDSRVHVTSIFGSDTGEFFIHRNIANLVPPFCPDGDYHGTSAALEYAVKQLRIAHIIVLGHSNCGGVNSYYQMRLGKAPELTKDNSFVAKWIDILRPGYDKISKTASMAEQIRELEYQGIIISLGNLLTFPFIRSAISAELLSIHGLWNSIGDGSLFFYEGGIFRPVT